MDPIRETVAEYPVTTFEYARITVRIDLPEAPHTLSQAMMISDHEIEKLKREWELREHLEHYKDDSAGQLMMMDLHKAQDEARMVRQIIANKIAIALSDAFRPKR